MHVLIGAFIIAIEWKAIYNFRKAKREDTQAEAHNQMFYLQSIYTNVLYNYFNSSPVRPGLVVVAQDSSAGSCADCQAESRPVSVYGPIHLGALLAPMKISQGFPRIPTCIQPRATPPLC